jgi:hypothetical protein
MKKTFSFLAVLAVLIPAAAQAQWSLGARTGYAIPLGDADGTAKMSDTVSGQIPLQLDIGYRLANTQLTLGGYFSYGFGSVAGTTQDLCDLNNVSCSSSSLRVGVQMLYALATPQEPTQPWIGLGLGYDSITVSGVNDVTISGTEFLNFQGGMDWKVGATGSLGAFASFSLGQYSDISGSGFSGTLADKKMHQWLTVGLRGSFGLGQQ